jgi:hypothetical protein
MPYEVWYWPDSVYPGGVKSECPEGEAVIDVLIQRMKEDGLRPEGYQVKTLGQAQGGMWQLNLKVGTGRQVRLLYSPYDRKIVLFRIHQKSSKPEQDRAYELARDRKRAYEQQQARETRDNAGRRPSR